jgi:hypothetical protein
MATRLHQVLSFVAVGGGLQTSLPHSINVNGVAWIPDIVLRDNGNFTIDAVTTTTVTVTNTGGAAGTCNVWLFLLHSEERAFGTFGASQTHNLTPNPFIVASGGNTGNPAAFTFTATGAEGSDFFVTLPTARGNDTYKVQGTLSGVASIIGFNCPNTVAGDRTTTQFRVITSGSVTAGDQIDFYVTDGI